MAALRILDAAGIVPVDLGLRRPSLDELFLSLTGRSTGDDDLAVPLTTTPAPPSRPGAPHDRRPGKPRPPAPPEEPATTEPARLPRSAIFADAVVVARRNLARIARAPPAAGLRHHPAGHVRPAVPLRLRRRRPRSRDQLRRVPDPRRHRTNGRVRRHLHRGRPVPGHEHGIIDRFRSLPMSRSAVLAGRTIADLARNVFMVLLMIVVGVAVGFRLHNGFGPAVAAVFVALLLGYALSWVFAPSRPPPPAAACAPAPGPRRPSAPRRDGPRPSHPRRTIASVLPSPVPDLASSLRENHRRPNETVLTPRTRQADTTSHQRSTLPATRQGHDLSSGAQRTGRKQCSPAGGYQAPSLPYGGPINLIRRILGVLSRWSIQPAVARMVMASSIPRAAVAVSGIM
jgi:ABC-2 type transporter